MNKVKKIFAVMFAIMAVMLMSTAVWAEVISGSCYDYDTDTGVLTLKNNIDRDMVRNFEYKQEVVEIKFGTGAILPNNCDSLFSGYSTCEKITVSRISTSNVINMRWMFSGCTSLETLDFSSLDTSNVVDMKHMFDSCSSLTSLNLSKFDTSKVTDMNAMFSNCKKLSSLDLRGFDTSNVTNMNSMFRYCQNLSSLDISKFNTSNVTHMITMFAYCSNLTSLDVGSFDTGNVTDMTGMFDSCEKLTSLDLSNFKTNNVKTMNYMFRDCKKLSVLDISGFDTLNVYNMNEMFHNCQSLTKLDLTNFNTSKVIRMSNMFYGCSKLTELDLSSFDTSRVDSMSYMFYWCYNLKSIDLSNFNTSNVKTMYSMFEYCYRLEAVDLSSFDTSNVTYMSRMFMDCKALTSLDLSKFDTSKVIESSSMFRNADALTSLKLGPKFFKTITANMGLIYDDNGWRNSKDISRKISVPETYEGKKFATFSHSGNNTYLRVELCTVTYDANDGSGRTQSVTAVKAHNLTLPECTFTAPSGKVFNKWQVYYTPDAYYGYPGDMFAPTEDMTVKAIWADGVTVSFAQGLGSGTMSNITAGKDTRFFLPESTFTPPMGYIFSYWDKDGSIYHAGDEAYVTANTTFTAKYRNYYVVKYDANDGGGSMNNINVTVGEKLTLPECKFSVPSDDYIFSGWLVGNKKFQPGEKADITEDTVVYALWAARDYWKAVFNAGDGSGNMSEIHIPHDGTHILTLPECTFNSPSSSRSFYKWKINNFYYFPGEEMTVTSDIEVTAIWLSCDARFFSDTGGGIKSVSVNVPYGKEYTLPEYSDILALNSNFIGPAATMFDHWRIKDKDYYPNEKIVISSQYTDIYAVYIYAGSCGTDGDNCTWTFDPATGTLTVSGSGRMTAYTKDNRPPWYDLKDKIKKVVIENGVTYVGSWAFEGCTQLTEAILADSILSIGSSAFMNTGLTGIELPKKIKIIADHAFANTNMTYIIVPESITTLNSSYSVGYNCDTSTSPWSYTRVDDFVVCGYAGSAAETYASEKELDFIQIGNVNSDENNIVDEADAALLLKYISGTANLTRKQIIASRVTDSIKDDPDMLDVIAILNS